MRTYLVKCEDRNTYKRHLDQIISIKRHDTGFPIIDKCALEETCEKGDKVCIKEEWSLCWW